MNARSRTAFTVAFIACVLDQLSKWWLIERLGIASLQRLEILPGFNLVMVWNRGISFGMFGGASLSPYVFIVLSLVIVGLLLRWLAQTHDRWLTLAIGLVIGGAAGNVIDRLRYGAVADFFDFYIGRYHWPAFNVADACIFIGVVVLCWQSMMGLEEKS